jgi:hypothetical protein
VFHSPRLLVGEIGVSSTTGGPFHNEDLTIRTVLMLARYFKSKGANLGAVEPLPPGAADCKILTADPKRPILVQVVRAELDASYWTRLSRSRATTAPERTPEGAWRTPVAGDTGEARSGQQRHHSRGNALRTPAFAFPAVVEAFRRRYSDDARGLGFEQVWICGPTEDLVHRLDERRPVENR